MEVEAFCLKCKCKRTLVNARLTRASRSGGRLNLKGECSVCGKVANKLVSGKTAKEMGTVREPPKGEIREEPREERPVIESLPKLEYKALCRGCRQEHPIAGGQAMRHFSQGMVIVGGSCSSCGWIGMFLKAEKIEVEAEF